MQSQWEGSRSTRTSRASQNTWRHACRL